jgi:transcriptional regulator GlxA family with amidase domain
MAAPSPTLRLQLALLLLSRSNLTIKQIANRCRFASQFQFSRFPLFRGDLSTPAAGFSAASIRRALYCRPI